MEILVADLRGGQVARLSAFRHSMYRQVHTLRVPSTHAALCTRHPRSTMSTQHTPVHICVATCQDALCAALLALAELFEREAEAAPLTTADADSELRAAALADDLTVLREALERCSTAASGGALEAARAARDRLAKRDKKAKVREKKAIASTAEGTGAGISGAALPSGAVRDVMTRRATAADEADDSEDEETAAALAAAAEARAKRRAEAVADGLT